MPLLKILFKPGVNKENTRYTTEGGWYDCDKVRFRQGSAEKIGGWTRISANTFLGVCRSLWNWITLAGSNLIGVGTHLKFYINTGGTYYDITPIRASSTINNNPFVATLSSSVITVTDTAHGGVTNDFVTFSGAVGLGGNITATVLNAEYQITVINANSYTITVSAVANATDVSGSPGGGAAVVAAYQVSTGTEIQQTLVGWGAGGWGLGPWGTGVTTSNSLRIWNQRNFGEDLVYGPRGGGIFYWDATVGLNTRGVNLTTLGDADTPVAVSFILVSDFSRFVLCMGVNDYGSAVLDPMLIRWSDQEDAFTWTPSITNQAGSARLSAGSFIVTAVQTRQEIVVFTNTALYSLQYVGPPFVWSVQTLGDNVSISGPNAVTLAAGVIYWMGVDKFYIYDGRIQTLSCNLLRHIFNDFNRLQAEQVTSGSNEGFNEIWWYYCSEDSDVVDKYVIYNYIDKIWYFGNLGRTAWLDSGMRNFPMAATYSYNIVNHESGVDDNETATPLPIAASISSSEFDIEDGHNIGFVYRVLPDLTFDGSAASPTPQVTMTLFPMQNAGSGTGNAASASVVKSSSYVVTEEFTGQIFVRARGRQMIFKISSTQLGTTWQLGAPRFDIRKDGRR